MKPTLPMPKPMPYRAFDTDAQPPMMTVDDVWPLAERLIDSMTPDEAAACAHVVALAVGDVLRSAVPGRHPQGCCCARCAPRLTL